MNVTCFRVRVCVCVSRRCVVEWVECVSTLWVILWEDSFSVECQCVSSWCFGLFRRAPGLLKAAARPFTPGPRHHGSLCSLIPHWLYVLNKNAVFTLFDWGIFRRHGTNVSALFQRLHCEGGLLLFNQIQPSFNLDIFAHANHLISANCAKTYGLFSLTKGLHGHSKTCCSSKRMKWDILVEPVEWNANKTSICEKYVIKSNKRLNDLS